MTQTELEIKQNELSRAYCAKTEPIKREISEGDIKVREVRQDISRLYEELRNLRDHRTEMEHKLRLLKDEYLEERCRILQAFENEREPSLSLTSLVGMLRPLAEEYHGQTIDSILCQLEARATEVKPCAQIEHATINPDDSMGFASNR